MARPLGRHRAVPLPGPAAHLRRDGAQLRREARAGRQLPFVVEVDGRFVGQLTVSNIVRGSAQFASVGYWIDERLRRPRHHHREPWRWSVDHCFGPVGLHRIEVAIRPENTSSLRVVEKLGFAEVGFAPRYLHIDGDWRDHRMFALTREEVPGRAARRGSTGLERPARSHQSQE